MAMVPASSPLLFSHCSSLPSAMGGDTLLRSHRLDWIWKITFVSGNCWEQGVTSLKAGPLLNVPCLAQRAPDLLQAEWALGCTTAPPVSLALIFASPLTGESIPIRLFLAGYELTPTMRDINKKFSVRYYLNLVLIDEEERRYFKQQVGASRTLGPFGHRAERPPFLQRAILTFKAKC